MIGLTPQEKAYQIDLAKTAYGEARGEGEIGMRAVINQVMNRVEASKTYAWARAFGSTPSAVCRKPFQYSCWNKGDANRKIIDAVTAADPLYALALKLAAMALRGDLPDITNGADHYYAPLAMPYIKGPDGKPLRDANGVKLRQIPKWIGKMRETARIGGHIFLTART